MPGKFVNKYTGAELNRIVSSQGPQFCGTVHEWYETLLGVIHDAVLTVKGRTNQMPATLEVSPEILSILEALAGSPGYCCNTTDAGFVPGCVGRWAGLLGFGDFVLRVFVDERFPFDTAKVVLVTDKKVVSDSLHITPADKLQAYAEPGSSVEEVERKAIDSLFDGDWRLSECRTEHKLPRLTRLDGITIKVLDFPFVR
jgi:hypothetical protein